jgi:quercetin dioxygenase-like cupin family protein
MDEPTDPGMTELADLSDLVEITPDATVSRTVLRADGVRLVLFGFDSGQDLSEHTAAVPVLLQTVTGALDVTADGRTVRLVPGAVLHLGPRVPHSVVAVEPSRLLLVLLDRRGTG